VSLGAALDGKRICVCAGPGGVGKTTIAAAVATGLAARGTRVAVVTIDPARRLADALGVGPLSNDPQRVPGASGELWALALDAKQTFDAVIERLAPDAPTRDAILANRIYRELSTAVGGSQEFAAVAKLHELATSERFDIVVLDTPPSRNALDFLDAPHRLAPLLQSRAMRVLAAPTGVMAAGAGFALGGLRRLTGVELLEDLAELLGALSDLADGLADQAVAVERLLADEATAFLLVASPERMSVAEALRFSERLEAAGGGVSALVVNRVLVRATDRERLGAAELAPGLDGDERLAELALRALGELRAVADRHARGIEALTGAVGAPALLVPDLERPVADVGALGDVTRHLFAGEAERARLLDASAF
jgi:anion-transporting  ArsA/GET3 family ATPase